MAPPIEAKSIASSSASGGEGFIALRRRKYEKRSWAKIHYPVSRCRKLRPKLRL
jgi:hypothetical protein